MSWARPRRRAARALSRRLRHHRRGARGHDLVRLAARRGGPPPGPAPDSNRGARRRVPPGRRATPRHDGRVERRRHVHRAPVPARSPRHGSARPPAGPKRLVRRQGLPAGRAQLRHPGRWPRRQRVRGRRRLHARRAHPPHPRPRYPRHLRRGAATPATGNGSSTWSTTRCWTTSTPSSAGSTAAGKQRSTSSRATA